MMKKGSKPHRWVDGSKSPAFPKPHDWVREQSDKNAAGKRGVRYRCSGCGHGLFMPHGLTDFQQRLTRLAAFNDCCTGLEPNVTWTLSQTFGATKAKSIYSLLAGNCDLVKPWFDLAAVYIIMGS